MCLSVCMQVNFLSHFYLTNLIIQRQSAVHKSSGQDEGERSRSRSLRVVNVLSSAYSRGNMAHVDEMTSGRSAADNMYQAYADSKLAMMLFTAELNFRQTGNDVVCLAAHPGRATHHLFTLHKTSTVSRSDSQCDSYILIVTAGQTRSQAVVRIVDRPERQSARMSKITNDGFTRSGTGCFTAVPVWQQWASKG